MILRLFNHVGRCGNVTNDSSADCFHPERFASLAVTAGSDVNQGEFRDFRQQTERCNRLCSIRLCRRHCARSVLGLSNPPLKKRPAAWSNPAAGFFCASGLLLTRFFHANRYLPPDQARGHASLENAFQKFEQLDPVTPPITKSRHISPGLSGSGYMPSRLAFVAQPQPLLRPRLLR